MKLELRRSGGIVGNARRPPLIVDTDQLDPDEARELEALVDELGRAAPPPQRLPGADRMQLLLAVERGGERRTLEFGDVGAPPQLRELARRMRELA